MKNETVKTGMKIGAVVGGILFLAFGVMAGFYFGSYGTLFILQKLMGGTAGKSKTSRFRPVAYIVPPLLAILFQVYVPSS